MAALMYAVIEPLKHDGKHYRIGDCVEMTPEQAAACPAVGDAVDPELVDDDKNTDEEQGQKDDSPLSAKEGDKALEAAAVASSEVKPETKSTKAK